MEAGIRRAIRKTVNLPLNRRASPREMLQAVIETIQARPSDARLVFLSDFDGTLAEFDDNPVLPWPSRETQRLLASLADRSDMSFGVVSGRRLEDVRARTVFSDHAYFAGLHGLEIAIGERRWRHPRLELGREHVHHLADELRRIVGEVPGLHLEDKDVSVAMHYRRVHVDNRAAAEALVERTARGFLDGGQVRCLHGQLVHEFLPNVDWDKGKATQWIVHDVETRFGQPAWVVFVGDDVTDEDAFDAIERGVGVRVGRRPTAADYQLDSTRDVTALLAWLAHEG
jgi:trehalose-phosphatase